jgi:kynurenine 3-monooxygenase
MSDPATATPGRVNIVGAGLAGPLLAVLLARQGLHVALYERRPDPRLGSAERGRSINLALAARGIRALEQAGVMARVAPLMIEMQGRCLHDHHGGESLLRYGQRPGEVIHSISRAALNLALVEAAAELPNVELHFGQACRGIDLAADALQLRDARAEGGAGADYTAPLAVTIATDGAGSAVRRSLEIAGRVTSHEQPLGHAYKELAIEPLPDGSHRLFTHALHIWPRGDFMLIALPNTDGSFTATLFLPRTGPVSFEALGDAAAVQRLFEREFPTALPLLPDLATQFLAHPEGQLATLHCAPWYVAGKVLLLGDAAHAIVPFHGQGMNCAFEDCAELATLVSAGLAWPEAFAEFERRRRPEAAAIAQMALENYVEMRATVLDPRFQRCKTLGLRLEQRHPRQFIPRYSMVSFHPEIPYSEALRRGTLQQQLLDTIEAKLAGENVATADLAWSDALVAASGL